MDELRANRLEVVLVPDRWISLSDTRRLRAVQSQNSAWYREFCGRYESRRRFRGRKFKTRIKRRETERALARIVQSYAFTRDALRSGITPKGVTLNRSPYESRLLELIAELREDEELRRRLLPW